MHGMDPLTAGRPARRRARTAEPRAEAGAAPPGPGATTGPDAARADEEYAEAYDAPTLVAIDNPDDADQYDPTQAPRQPRKPDR